MRPIEFAEQTIILAKEQPEYQPLPIHMGRDGTATSCWELTAEEIAQIQITKVIWIQQLTFGRGFSPQLPSAEKPAPGPPPKISVGN